MVDKRSTLVLENASLASQPSYVRDNDLFPEVIFGNLHPEERAKLRSFLSGEIVEEREIDCAELD